MSIELLKWYYEMGVDEAISDVPHTNFLASDSTPQPPVVITNPVTTLVNIMPRIASKPLAVPEEIIAQARIIAESCNTLAELKQAVEAFEGCALKRTATSTVFSDGNPNAEIMLIGEAPGANEDVQGIPFCGDSGKLLDVMLGSVGIMRTTNLYISNCLFWRPPGNRAPSPEELAICLPFVERHIAIVRPKILILAGATAVWDLLQLKEGITKLRGREHQYINRYIKAPIPVSIIFHPSYLLRQPSQKKQLWFDLLKIKHFIQEQNIRM